MNNRNGRLAMSEAAGIGAALGRTSQPNGWLAASTALCVSNRAASFYAFQRTFRVHFLVVLRRPS